MLRSNTKGGDGAAAISSRTQALWDGLAHCSSIAQTLYSGEERERKVKVGLSCRQMYFA